MNVLFVYSLHYYRLKRKQVVADSIQLGISYISSFLKKNGHKTELIVLSRFLKGENNKIIDSCLHEFEPKLICFTSVASEYPFISEVARYIKSNYPDVCLLIGGPHVSLNPDFVLDDGFDALCVGEGERPTLELVQQLEGGKSPSKIPNLWIKHGAAIEKNNPLNFMENLDSLPFPDREMWQKWTDQEDARYSVLLGRGCPFQCTYCCNHALRKIAPGKYVRFRSPSSIVEEIEEIQPLLLKNKEIHLELETISINQSWAFELCSKLEKFNQDFEEKISFGVNFRIIPGVNFENLFCALKKANFKRINIGLESGSQRIRSDVLKRYYSNEDVINNVNLAKKYGLKVCFFNIVGLPGETAVDFEETVKMNRLCQPDWHFTSIFFPYQGTDLYNLCKRQGFLDQPLDTNMERRKAALDFPEMSKKQINKNFTWFDYYVYKGYRPAFKILMNIFMLKSKILISSLLFPDNDKFKIIPMRNNKGTSINQTRTRIALICTSINQLGGKNKHLKNLYKYLNDNTFKIFIFCCSSVKDELKDFMIRNGVADEDLVMFSRIKKWMVIPFIMDLKNKLVENRINIVHTLDIQSDIFGAFAARLAGIKCLLSLFESKAIVENISFLKQLAYKTFNFPIRKWFIRNIVVSEGLKKELISEKFRLPESIKVIHLGFKIPGKYKGCKWSFERLKKGNPVIGTISRLSREKAIDRFVAAMPFILQQVPDAEFIIVGKGPEEERLKGQAEKNGLDSKIVFREWTNDVFKMLESIDIFVMPSVREGCPTALLEALALCRPIIASDIEGIRDIIENGKDGILVDTLNISLFAKGVISLCQNPEKAIAMGESGYKKVANQFTIEHEIDQLKELYGNVTGHLLSDKSKSDSKAKFVYE